MATEVSLWSYWSILTVPIADRLRGVPVHGPLDGLLSACVPELSLYRRKRDSYILTDHWIILSS